ncbi:MAG: hypothetical protein EOP82_26845, partial [Variovorax sp.]
VQNLRHLASAIDCLAARSLSMFLMSCMVPTSTDATTHRLVGKAGGAKVAVFMGKPLHQPVLSNGPMAFANRDNLVAAAAAYHRGDMGSL